MTTDQKTDQTAADAQEGPEAALQIARLERYVAWARGEAATMRATTETCARQQVLGCNAAAAHKLMMNLIASERQQRRE